MIDNSHGHSETQAWANTITSSLRLDQCEGDVFLVTATATSPVRLLHIVDELAAPRVKR